MSDEGEGIPGDMLTTIFEGAYVLSRTLEDPAIGVVMARLRLLDSPTLLNSRGNVLHVAGFSRSVTDYFGESEVIRINVSPDGLDSLAAFIHRAYARDSTGQAVLLGPGLYGESRFYAGRERYHLFHNCNAWTAEALPRILDAIDAAEEIPDPLDGLVEKSAEDPGAAFTPKVLDRLVALRQQEQMRRPGGAHEPVRRSLYLRRGRGTAELLRVRPEQERQRTLGRGVARRQVHRQPAPRGIPQRDGSTSFPARCCS